MRRANSGSDFLDWAVSMSRLAGAAALVAASQMGASARRQGLDAIRHAAAERLRGSARDFFRLGEQMERGMVDTLAGFAERPPVEPAEAAGWWHEILARANTRRRGAPPAGDEEPGDA